MDFLMPEFAARGEGFALDCQASPLCSRPGSPAQFNSAPPDARAVLASARSMDLYLGSKAPEGKAGNWLATVPGMGYFAILRLYGPTEAAFDKSWKPSDFEKVK
jgi:hypothetical protein